MFTVYISIHALRVEGDSKVFDWFSIALKFLSTPSVWRATLVHFGHHVLLQISIHALRVEGDAGEQSMRQSERRFLSTPSVWRATYALKSARLDSV